MREPIPEPNAAFKVTKDGFMVQWFRNTLLRLVRFANSGKIYWSYTYVDAAYTITEDDALIECSGTFTIDLTTAVGEKGRELIFKNSGAGTITLDADGSETIDGNLTDTISAGNSLRIVSNDSNWLVV